MRYCRYNKPCFIYSSIKFTIKSRRVTKMNAENNKKYYLKPIIKWAGGKGQLINEISKKYPEELGLSIKKYAEPFIGGGAVLFDILNKFDLEEIYISDINAELINTYIQVKENVEDLIAFLYDYENTFLKSSADERKKIYYKKRERYNTLIVSENSKNIESASLFIFLNKTCFNGLYRVNRKGLYNVPMGSYKNPKICDEKNLREVSKALANVYIVCADYRKSHSFIDQNTLVYFDPPYRPLNITSSFTSYNCNGFDDNSQAELAKYVQILSQKGAYVIVSNSDPKNSNPDDNFFDILYSKQNISRISANRMINSNAKLRGRINELLISNY